MMLKLFTDLMKIIGLFPLLLITLFGYIIRINALQSDDVKHVVTRASPYHYVYKEFRRRHYTQGKFHSKDPTYKYIPYDVKENIEWNGKSVCKENTFILLLYFVNKRDRTRRDLIRRYIHQGMVVGNVTFNYAIVVAADKVETKAIALLEKENKKYGDLLLSIHVDSYSNVTLTVLDSFLWVREHCKQAVFIGRIDGDTWVNLSNLVEYLKAVPRTRFYGGYRLEGAFPPQSSGSPFFVPNDYPPKRWLFNAGGAYIVSNDLVPYINIGTLYSDLIPHAAEDGLIGDILRKVQVVPYKRVNRFVLYSNLQWFPNKKIPSNAIFVHNIKDVKELTTVYENNP